MGTNIDNEPKPKVYPPNSIQGPGPFMPPFAVAAAAAVILTRLFRRAHKHGTSNPRTGSEVINSDVPATASPQNPYAAPVPFGDEQAETLTDAEAQGGSSDDEPDAGTVWTRFAPVRRRLVRGFAFMLTGTAAGAAVGFLLYMSWELLSNWLEPPARNRRGLDPIQSWAEGYLQMIVCFGLIIACAAIGVVTGLIVAVKGWPGVRKRP
ncbi:MAG: hypothetical protein WKF77_23885 [Planctomycetaceae bacterium]